MTTMAQLVALGDATTNPAPSTLSPSNPFGTTGGGKTPQQSWVTQAKKALIALQPEATTAVDIPKCQVDFNPSGGAAVTYTVTAWRFNRFNNVWHSGGAKNYTGPTTDYIENFGSDPWFLQLSSVSAGTVEITYDSEVMLAI